MSRLTKEIDNNEYVVANYTSLNEPWKTPINKLGQLEDVEEELGVELVTLFKALKYGIFVNNYRYKGYLQSSYLTTGYSQKDEKIVWKLSYGALNKELVELRDYGKTWALTKEELENDEIF